jgi:hypothetical protein
MYEPRTIEVVYTWQNGRKEVRYRATEGTEHADNLTSQVECQKALHGKDCPYSIRYMRTHKRTAK